MPIRKFRSVKEMDGAHWYEPGDPALYKAIRRVWELGHRTLRPRFTPGVTRYRTIEEMNLAQEQVRDAHFREYHERLKRESETQG